MCCEHVEDTVRFTSSHDRQKNGVFIDLIRGLCVSIPSESIQMNIIHSHSPVSYTHLTLPTTPYV